VLKAKNNENELLLKEIHHRVKNNLEMVSSLLKLQSVKTKDAEAKGVMEASQNRVQSMGIIHQKLYQGDNLASIEMKDYFQNLSENLLDAFGLSEKVKVKYDMDPVELDVDTAVPIGLIVNELLTNSLKYAFPDDQKGEIELSLKETEKNKLHLLVADNGIGQSDHTTVKGTGFGSQLVKLLTMQLQGKMNASYENGTRLSFWLEKANMA
jgi:two-component sensor histidine kinase